MSTISHRTADDHTRSVVIAVVIALIGLALVVASVTLGQTAADLATRVAGGAMAESRYELVWQLNAIAYAFSGAVLLGVGAFAALRRA